MANRDLQKKMVDTIVSIVDAKLNRNTTTNSRFGYVVNDPEGFSAIVSINGEEYQCTLPEHLHTWVQKDDVVIIQDLFGNGSKLVITGKTGSRMETPQLVFFDEDKAVSGVDVLIDEKGNKVNSAGTIVN